MSYWWNKYSIRLVPWNKYYSIIFSFWNKYYQEQLYVHILTVNIECMWLGTKRMERLARLSPISKPCHINSIITSILYIYHNTSSSHGLKSYQISLISFEENKMFLAGHNVFLDKVVTLTFKIDKPDLFMKHSLVVCYNKTQYKLILSGRHIYACVSYCCNEE